MSTSSTAPVKPSSSRPGIRKRWIVLALLAILVVWLVFFWGVVRKSWTEEVELAAGDVVVIERRKKLVKVYQEWPKAGLQTRFNALRLPDGVRFETEDRISLIWLGRGASARTWVLIAVANYCEEFRKYGLTDYVQLEYSDGSWSHRAIQPEYIGRAANLLVSDKYANDGALVTLAEKKAWNSVVYGLGESYLAIERDQRDLDRRVRRCTEGWKSN